MVLVWGCFRGVFVYFIMWFSAIAAHCTQHAMQSPIMKNEGSTRSRDEEIVLTSPTLSGFCIQVFLWKLNAQRINRTFNPMDTYYVKLRIFLFYIHTEFGCEV